MTTTSFAGGCVHLQKSPLIHSVAAPFQIEPAALGFDLVFFSKDLRTAIALIQRSEAMDEQNGEDIILTTGNLGHIQIPTIIPSIGITLLVFLIHSRLSIIPMAHLSLRTLKEGSI